MAVKTIREYKDKAGRSFLSIKHNGAIHLCRTLTIQPIITIEPVSDRYRGRCNVRIIHGDIDVVVGVSMDDLSDQARWDLWPTDATRVLRDSALE